MFELLREVSDSFKQKPLPLETIEDFLELFDSCQKHATAVVFYHTCLVQTFAGEKLGYETELDLLLSSAERDQVAGFEFLD